MFHVLVTGGIALVAPPACGGRTDSAPTMPVNDAAADAREDVFPSELPVALDAGGQDAFPSELPAFVDAGANDAANDAFPSELPVFVDAGANDAAEDAFPSELPVAVDAGSLPDATSEDGGAAPDAGFPSEK